MEKRNLKKIRITSSQKIEQNILNEIRGGTAQPKTSHSRPLTGFYTSQTSHARPLTGIDMG